MRRSTHLARVFLNVGLVGVGVLLGWLFIANRAASPWASAAQNTQPAVQSSEARAGYDPLSLAEKDRALALGRPALEAAAREAAGSKAALRLEMLRVERHQEDKATYARGEWTRRADVWVYAYGQDVLYQATVALEAGVVDRIEAVRGVQPPLTANETAQAFQIALNDAQTGAAIRAQFQQIKGETLQRAEQLQVAAVVFHSDSTSDATLANAGCGPRRCAQLLINTPDGVQLSVLPTVDLSQARIVAVKP